MPPLFDPVVLNGAGDGSAELSMAVQYEAAYWVIVAVLFVYGLSVGFWFYLKPSESRLQAMVKAHKHHQATERHAAAAATAQATRASWRGSCYRGYLQFKRQFALVSVVIRFVQYLGLIFVSSVPWSFSGLSSGGSAVLLDFAFVQAVVQQLFFWLFVALYAALALLAAHREFVYHRAVIAAATAAAGTVGGGESAPQQTTRRPVGQRERWVRAVVLNVAFITGCHQLFKFLACEPDPTVTTAEMTHAPPVIVDVDRMQCWAGAHVLYAVVALVTSACIYPWSLHFVLTDHGVGQSAAFFTLPSYQVFTKAFELCIVLISVFFRGSPAAAMTLLFVCFAVNLGCNFWLQPCLSAGRRVNHWRSASYAGALWCVVCSLIAIGVDDRSQPAPAALLVIAPFVMAAAYVLSARYLKRLDESKLTQMAHAATSTDRRLQREAYANMAVLCTVDENRDVIVANVLPGAMALLAAELHKPGTREAAANAHKLRVKDARGNDVQLTPGAAVDRAVKFSILQTIASLAGLEGYDGALKLFDAKIVGSLARLLDARKPLGDYDEVRAVLTILVNFADTPALAATIFVHSKGLVENLLCLLPNADQTVRRHAIDVLLSLTFVTPKTQPLPVDNGDAAAGGRHAHDAKSGGGQSSAAESSVFNAIRDELQKARNVTRIARATVSRDPVMQIRAARIIERLVRPKTLGALRDLKLHGPEFLGRMLVGVTDRSGNVIPADAKVKRAAQAALDALDPQKHAKKQAERKAAAAVKRSATDVKATAAAAAVVVASPTAVAGTGSVKGGAAAAAAAAGAADDAKHTPRAASDIKSVATTPAATPVVGPTAPLPVRPSTASSFLARASTFFASNKVTPAPPPAAAAATAAAETPAAAAAAVPSPAAPLTRASTMQPRPSTAVGAAAGTASGRRSPSPAPGAAAASHSPGLGPVRPSENVQRSRALLLGLAVESAATAGDNNPRASPTPPSAADHASASSAVGGRGTPPAAAATANGRSPSPVTETDKRTVARLQTWNSGASGGSTHGGAPPLSARPAGSPRRPAKLEALDVSAHRRGSPAGTMRSLSPAPGSAGGSSGGGGSGGGGGASGRLKPNPRRSTGTGAIGSRPSASVAGSATGPVPKRSSTLKSFQTPAAAARGDPKPKG